MKTLKKIGIALFGTLIFISCGSDDSPTEQPQNQAPNVSLTNVTSNDDTNSVSGTLVATDNDGTIMQKTLEAEATDGTLVTISLSGNGTFNHTFTNNGKIFDTLLASVKDNDNATDETFAILNPSITVETPNTAPTGNFNDIITPIPEGTISAIGDIVSTVNTNDVDGDTVTVSLTNNGGGLVSLDGNNIKLAQLPDYETNQTVDIQAQLDDGNGGITTIDYTLTIGDENDIIGLQKLCGGHGVDITQQVDVANNNPASPNSQEFLLDENGNATNTTLSQAETALMALNWSEAGGNLGALASSLQASTLLAPLSLTFDGNGIVRPDGDSMTVENFGRILEDLKNEFSFNYVNSNDFLGSGNTISTLRWRAVFTKAVENIRKEIEGANLNDASVMLKIKEDVVKDMANITSEAEATTYLTAFLNGTETGGVDCD